MIIDLFSSYKPLTVAQIVLLLYMYYLKTFNVFLMSCLANSECIIVSSL